MTMKTKYEALENVFQFTHSLCGGWFGEKDTHLHMLEITLLKRLTNIYFHLKIFDSVDVAGILVWISIVTARDVGAECKSFLLNEFTVSSGWNSH